MLRSWILGALLMVAPVAADTVSKITLKDLQKKGVITNNFSVFHVGEGGRTILAADEPNFVEKRKGPLNRLLLLKLDDRLQFESVKVYPLTIPKVEQANFTPDLKSVMISYRKGAFIDKLNLETGAVEPFMHHKTGEAGFRIHSDIFSWWGGKLYTIGYFYDAEDFGGNDEMVEIDTDKTGPAAFTSVLKVAELQKEIPNWNIASTLHPSAVFHYAKHANRWTVHRWNSNGHKQIDEGTNITGSWGEGPRALYTITRANGNTDVMLSNGQTEENRTVYSGPNKFVNPCLAKDGNTLVVARRTDTNVAEYWVGEDTNNYELRKVAEKMPASTLRVSHDGSVISAYNGITGLTLIKLGP